MTLITMTALYGDDTVDDSGVLHLPLEFMLYIKTRSVFFFFFPSFFSDQRRVSSTHLGSAEKAEEDLRSVMNDQMVVTMVLL